MIRIALAQFDFPVGAVEANAARIAGMIVHARDVHRADVVLFPETALSGYPAEDLLLRPSFLHACQHALEAIARDVRGIVAVVGHPQAAGSVVYNAASVLRSGRIEHTYRKRELPNYAVFDERRYFATGDRPCVFDVKGATIGLIVCEDLWFAHPLADTAAAGACMVLVPNASPFETEKHFERDSLLQRRVEETGVALAYLNQVGGQDDVVFDGGSVLADGDGTLHPSAEVFADHWLLADFDPEARRFQPIDWPAEREETNDSLCYRALVRATRDYVLKNGFSRVWIGLSGGVDSALTLAIAVDALGADAVTAVRLPSRYTADLSNDLAAEQATAMGVRLETYAIEAPFRGFVDALEGGSRMAASAGMGPVGAAVPVGATPSMPASVGANPIRDRPAEDSASAVANGIRSYNSGVGAEDPAPGTVHGDLTEENLQSRCRGALLMALSNRFGGLVLTTGNKSEYAVGYSTIYGDMCGAFAPLKDVYKTEVYALARFRNARGAVIPEGVLTRAPTAELRPGQTDQDSLPAYELLDAILYRFVDLERSRQEIVEEGYDEALVERIGRLVFVSEYKRRQSAPGPKVSRRAFGRERRYPITSGWR